MSSELGRELTVPELQVATVVVIRREDRLAMFTAWVYRVGTDYVAFKAGAIKTTFLAHRALDDILTDDTGQRIHVYEYLGEV